MTRRRWCELDVRTIGTTWVPHLGKHVPAERPQLGLSPDDLGLGVRPRRVLGTPLLCLQLLPRSEHAPSLARQHLSLGSKHRKIIKITDPNEQRVSLKIFFLLCIYFFLCFDVHVHKLKWVKGGHGADTISDPVTKLVHRMPIITEINGHCSNHHQYHL